MKFNYRAVSKKDRIIKTLVLGIPATLVIGFAGSLALTFAEMLPLSIIYYAVVLGIGFATGKMVRIVGRGLTTEFLVLGGVYGLFAILFAMYLSFSFSFGFPSLSLFLFEVIQFPFGYFSWIEVIFGVVVAISQSTVGA